MNLKFLSGPLYCLLCIIFAASAFGLNPQKATERKSSMLDGTWIPIKAELGGQKIPEAGLKNTKLVLKGDGYTVEVSGILDRGKIKLLPDSEPKAMHIIGGEGPNKGKTIPAIYELKDDTLTICYNLNGESLPAEFKTDAGSQLYLATYKRQSN